jgi:hypothetical protein
MDQLAGYIKPSALEGSTKSAGHCATITLPPQYREGSAAKHRKEVGHCLP